MSLVITAMSTRARNRRQSASVRAVLPEPTGPPIPILSGWGITGDFASRAEHPGVERSVAHAGDLEPGCEAPHVVELGRGRLASQPGDHGPQRGEQALAFELTDGHEAKRYVDQQRGRRVEIGRRGELGIGAVSAERGTEHHRVMAGRAAFVARAREPRYERIADAVGHARRLPSHLKARRPEPRAPVPP